MTSVVSVVCITYNRRDLVLRCLESCVGQDYPRLEILAVVNGSNDGTEEAIRRRFPEVKMIRIHRNIGFFPALNIGIANTCGDYVMVVDDDAYFMNRCALGRLVKAFSDEPALGAVTCNLEGPSETPVSRDCYIPVFTTGFTMLPKRVFTEWVGYYPDVFFRSGGETFVCTMLWDLGKPVKRLCDARMYHLRAMEGRSDWDWNFYGLRSQILVAVMREPWYLIGPSLASKGGKSLVDCLRGGHFRTWVSAWMSAMLYLPEAWSLRRPIRWRTRKLLWHLRREVVSDVDKLHALVRYGSRKMFLGQSVRE